MLCIPDGVNDNHEPKNLSNPDVCSPTYVKRPDSERSCSLIPLSCEFGVCIEMTDTIHCNCDLGATGQLCEQRCCRNCGAHGSCRVVPGSGIEECNCEKNYTGAFCEIPNHIANNSCNCVHGSCNDARTCICNKGWTGATCNISCSDHCGQGSTCAEVFSKVICNPTRKETTSQSQTTSIPRQDACSSDYVLRPVQERECMGIFNCTYGTCVIQGDFMLCQCDIGVSPGYQLCEHKCCKDCGNNGRCYYHPELNEICDCDIKYAGSLCEIYNPPVKYTEVEKVQWWFYLLAILIPIIVMTLFMSLVLMYLWKRRVIVVLKAVRLFQAYEDDDECQCDAFISFRSNTPDEDYVIHTLFPKLTREMGFNVNVHYKDFITGNEITNNIIYAVENSRRTILVVSPHYLTSNLTNMEWHSRRCSSTRTR
ncbi:neurogenic locus notch homolog protein 1-like [Dreissena polymorpha]|uniref:neurogenic locus notch homolog protein 1-like n=1 Tax=Dreissena polymorpha TaxID=45954 RepID=UPI002265656C|nr:neurogenic locus notch homolog protein 1-like [Dreissena polymorpha]